MKKILSILVLSAVLLTGCNSGKADTNDSYSETSSTTSVTEETIYSTSTSVTEETSSEATTKESVTSVTSISDTTSSESDKETDTETVATSNAPKSEVAKDTEHETINTIHENNESRQSETIQNGDRSSSNVRENDEGDIIVIAPETTVSETVEPNEPYNQNDDFQIVTEAPIELPFIPAN